MKIALLLTGKTTEKHVADGVEIYAGRLKKYCRFEIITIPELKAAKNMPVREQKMREGKKILEFLGKDDIAILLDERGKEFRTADFAGWLETKSQMQGKRLVFIVGGPWGFSDEVYSIAELKISLSRMTFPHQLVRLIFVEQLYRAFTIIKGEPYHHA